MPEEIQNIFDDVVELKKLNPWLGAFALTDNEVKEIIKLISRVILGAVKINDFYAELTKAESGYDVKGDEVIFGRFKNIIVARLKDIRDQLESTQFPKKALKK